jgi:osomolarity two-component system sensor histidine kinase NIK1
MACADETLTAAAAIIQNLVREAPSSGSPSFEFNFSPQSTNGVDSLPKLPGEPSLAKVRFENELEALVRRIHRMEVQSVSRFANGPYPGSTYADFPFYLATKSHTTRRAHATS